MIIQVYEGFENGIILLHKVDVFITDIFLHVHDYIRRIAISKYFTFKIETLFLTIIVEIPLWNTYP